MTRYNEDGSLDVTFDPNDVDGNGPGKVTTGFGSGSDVAHALAVQPDDGKTVVAGWSQASAGADRDFALARYNFETDTDGDGIPDTEDLCTNVATPPLCPYDLVLSNYQSAPITNQFVDITNIGVSTVDVSGCTHTAFDVFTQGSIEDATVGLFGTLAPGESFRLGSAGASGVASPSGGGASVSSSGW